MERQNERLYWRRELFGVVRGNKQSMRTPKLLKRWSRVMPDGAALKVIQWAWSESLIERIP
jgi:hypothetical protein